MKHNPSFTRDAARLEREWGIVPALALDYMPDEFRSDFGLAMDAQPTLVTVPNGGIPTWLTAYFDPEVVRVLQTPNKGAQIYPEKKNGNWTSQTAFFTVVENTGEVSSYGDFNNNGISDVNASFVERDAYLFQTHIIYGDLEVERAGLARLSWISEKQVSAAKTLDKFLDYTYHFGVAGLRNYGCLNDPGLSPALTPTTKAIGGSKWVNNGQLTADPREAFADFQLLYAELLTQSAGLIDQDTKMKVVLPNTVASALTAVNQFNVQIRGLLKDGFPNLEIIVDPRYATPAGNIMQLIATEFDGNATGYCAFNEKLRDHRLVPDTASFKQRKTSGTWGAVIRYPQAVATMIGL